MISMGTIEIIIVIVFVLLAGVMGIFFYLEKGKGDDINGVDNNLKKKKSSSTNSSKQEEIASVIDFMKFDKIQDNMIVLENGTKYVMVLQCQGINYYLMSENEKLSVEQGFIQLLNSLRHRIQFYIQTRRVDLKDSLSNYNKKIEDVEKAISQISIRIDELEEDPDRNAREIQMQKWELTKKERLLDYIKDVTYSVEKINSNRNVLQRKFYVVIPYYTADLGVSNNFDENEKRDIAYNELYTRASSLASALNTCSVESKILDSNELGELLYVAYNRDEANIFELKKALDSGFYKLYSTSKDVLQKKQEMYDEIIKEEAMAKAQEAVRNAIVDIMQEKELKEVFNKNVLKEAEKIIENSRANYSEEVIEKALDNVKSKGKRQHTQGNDVKPEKEVDDKIEKKTTKSKKTKKGE